ncbi:MAG: DeoR/GlpR family DNA-binding transcription regulator [Candidatus Limiplasma sp.]|nr:DeoR/GlpR family DNA-binding transcription regulator [Candidatus Limiplasma sp.]
MLKVERQQKIKEYMLEHKRVTVDGISRLLKVTPATVRTDFTQLEEEGYLVRFHGGASLNVIDYREDEINSALGVTSVQYDAKKLAVGAAASHLIQEKEWIFLGPGTTTYYIAKALAHRSSVHILTNNLLVANVIGANPSCEVRLLGGNIHSEGLYTQPADLHAELRGIYLSKVFFSVDGVDLNAGYTLSDVNVLDLFKTIYANCREMFMAIDSTKYGRRAFMKLENLNFKHSVITNEETPEEFLDYYRAHGVKVYTKPGADSML